MQRIAVRSSNIRSIGYDSSTQTLEVEFTSGELYQYSNVPSNVHDALMRAPSQGRFLNDQIKGRYRYTRL